MQKSHKHISKQVYDKHPEYSLEAIEELNKFLFQTLRRKIREGSNLIYKMGPLGSFVFRLKQTKLELYREKARDRYIDEDIQKTFQGIIDIYDNYKTDKLKSKYERFGKESHEAYLLAKKQKKLQEWERTKSEQHS